MVALVVHNNVKKLLPTSLGFLVETGQNLSLITQPEKGNDRECHYVLGHVDR